MPKYEIKLIEKEIYRFDSIEAETEEEAIDKAIELISTEEGKNDHHHDSDGDFEVYEI